MSTSERLFGRVKWFNNKAGYGFITALDSGSDIFAHHSAIKVSSEQYRYLVQGEYVEFTLSHVSSGAHESQSADITGIRGGMLMCETHRQTAQESQEHSKTDAPKVEAPKSKRVSSAPKSEKQKTEQQKTEQQPKAKRTAKPKK